MLVNYRVRCETDTMIDGIPCRVIRYGMSKAECNAGLYCPAWYDVKSHPFSGGRTTPIESEIAAKHFFNKRIIIDEEKIHNLSREEAIRILSDIEVHGDSDEGVVGAPDGAGSTDSTEEVEASAEGVGCGDQGTGEEVST